MATHKTEDPYEFWRVVLHSPRYTIAPMVDQSELAWRLLSRRYGAQLCYTPMLHAACFVKDSKYRKDWLQTTPEDQPLIVQFCANDPDVLVEACKYVVEWGKAQAVDINLGCPQAIAKAGRYGAFLQDEWELITSMIKAVRASFPSLPVTCKIRVFESVERSVLYGKMLEEAGAALLTVHGRTREQKGRHTGIASWHHVRAVREAVKIPVFSNGNIHCREDADKCIEDTGVVGVMSAEGNLHNPAIFSINNSTPYVWNMIREYLELVEEYPCSLSCIRGHIFKLAHHCLQLKENVDLRDILATSNELQKFKFIADELQKRHEGQSYSFTEEELAWRKANNVRPLPPWVCQPYVRPDPAEPVLKPKRDSEERYQDLLAIALPLVAKCDDSTSLVDIRTLSKNQLKKLKRNPRRAKTILSMDQRPISSRCNLDNCPNPKGHKCSFSYCRACCRKRVRDQFSSCPGHNIYARTRPRREELSTETIDNTR